MQDAFTIQIAGLVTCIQPLFMSTREYCRSYLSDEIPDYFVEVTEEDLLYEQEMLRVEALEEGIPVRKFTDAFLERATIQRKIAQALLDRDTFLLHGSTVGVDGAAYLFTGRCGTGKSTHTRFWRELFGPRAVMVNDDKPFLRITPSGVVACGTPWSGKHGLDSNITLPLKGICFLRRGVVNVIRPAKAEEFIDELLRQSFLPDDGDGDKVRKLVDTLAQVIPLWEMECTKDPQAAVVSYNAMSTFNRG